MGKNKREDLAPTPMEEVYAKVEAYRRKMNLIADFLVRNNAPQDIQIEKDKEFIGFYIDKPSLAALQVLANDPDCNEIAVYFGLADGAKNSLTGCFVAIDSHHKIVEHHFARAGAVGPILVPQDTWIPPRRGFANPEDLTLNVTQAELKAFFRQ